MDRDDRAIRTACFLRIPDVGDRITPSIVRALTGRGVRHFSGQLQPHLIAAGRVMAGATAAFPHRHLEQMREPAGRPVVPVEECGRAALQSS